MSHRTPSSPGGSLRTGLCNVQPHPSPIHDIDGAESTLPFLTQTKGPAALSRGPIPPLSTSESGKALVGASLSHHFKPQERTGSNGMAVVDWPSTASWQDRLGISSPQTPLERACHPKTCTSAVITTHHSPLMPHHPVSCLVTYNRRPNIPSDSTHTQHTQKWRRLQCTSHELPADKLRPIAFSTSSR